MKALAVLLLLSLTFRSCEKDNSELLIGKWRHVAGYNLMTGGKHLIPSQSQRMEEYTKDNIRIRYDFEGNEIVRSSYIATETNVKVYGVSLDGNEWSINYDYWFAHDTLKIRNDGGFEFSDNYFIRIE